MKEQYNFRRYLSTCNFSHLQRPLHLPSQESGSSDSFKARLQELLDLAAL